MYKAKELKKKRMKEIELKKKMDQEETEAAIKVQKIFRGKKARKTVQNMKKKKEQKEQE